MRKLLIIGIIIVVLIVIVSVYSCQVKGDKTEPDEPIGGLYTGEVAAVVQDPAGFTKIYWNDSTKKPIVVLGLWALSVGDNYVISCKETRDGLEITGIQIKK